MRKTLLLMGLALALGVNAQDYPNKPIRVLVGYSAGGGNDIIVRVMAPELSKGLGQPVVVENKPGAQSKRFATMGLEPVGGTPEELAHAVSRDLERYKAAAQAANIKNN